MQFAQDQRKSFQSNSFSEHQLDGWSSRRRRIRLDNNTARLGNSFPFGFLSKTVI
ncbi:hypothetical protein ANCCAN_22302 [Ancylostoma caninum]|uniref:Uncharacterized protein n=1 Tax=Ancylostoma caninum TaxID=29170 RepID=A0A368FIM4_ANCCA|nr:hypothetical protein ANCCAN_22302 [Ancylostoma caninum]